MKFKTIIIVSSCLWHTIIADENKIKNETAVKAANRRNLHISNNHLTLNERNRRLIPYATYYIADNSDNSAFKHNNHLSINDERLTTPTSSVPKQLYNLQPNYKSSQYKTEEDYSNDYPDTNSFVPLFYLTAGRNSANNDESTYRFSSFQQNSASAEDIKRHPPKTNHKFSTSTSASIAQKYPYAFLPNYADSVTQSPKVYYKYVVTPGINIKEQVETQKPPYITFPITSSSTPSEYLNFRYSNLLKSQSQKYDRGTAMHHTVEITSPKHYITSATESIRPFSNAHIVTTTPSTINHKYTKITPATPSTRSKSIKYSAKIPEQATQSSKTLMTIMKSHEIPYHPYGVDYQPYYIQQSPLHQQTTNFLKNSPEFTIDDVLNGYNINKQLPERITAENLQQSIKTLSHILQVLQKADSITQLQKRPAFHTKDIFHSLKESPSLLMIDEHKAVSPLQNVDVSYETYDDDNAQLFHHNEKVPSKEEQSTPGQAGVDYPVYSVIPETTFSCKTQRYKGFFADPETKCQVWHYCDLNGGQASFLCPNGTIFNQAALTCDWWFNVKCAVTSQLYVLNERLYKYILPVRPSFPEDFAGPLVDQYLSEKFKEIEMKRKYKYPTNTTTVTSTEQHPNLNLTALNEYEIPTHLLNENL